MAKVLITTIPFGEKDRFPLDLLEKELGFNWNPEWLLLDADLDIQLIAVFMWDWMHCSCIDGVLVKEVHAFMAALSKSNLGTQQLDQFLQLWPLTVLLCLRSG